MTIIARRVNVGEALEVLRADLNVSHAGDTDGRIELVAAVMRRLAGILCPCPRLAIRQAVARSLASVVPWAGELDLLAEAVIEGALVGGDLLELANVVVAEEHDHPTWLYCAPPGFVRGPGTRLYILGIPPDGALFLPTEVRERLRHQGSARFVEEQPGEGLPELLASLGLREMPGDIWRHVRRAETAAAHVATLQRRLVRDGTPGPVNELRVLRPAVSTGTPYAGRWALPDKDTGLRVGRFEGAFRNRMWCLAELEGGELRRYLRLPLRENPLAPSDAGWLAQLALDAVAGHPGTYRAAPRDGGAVITSTFPLPRFARRRFEYLGAAAPVDGPYAFWVPDAQRATEEAFLREQLWLAPATDKTEGGGSDARP